ncbi:MAG: GNAT family N-acetyltransferase [Anaerolineaceae bacterium]|nr:GNAT family N-acetyltransferase [Anaerolineaceae bacterium]
MIEYRVLDDVAAFEQIVDLEIAVWQLDPRDAVPSSMIHAIILNGGLLVGAYDEQRVVGLGFAFPVQRNRTWSLWSHMVGVHPDYRDQGIGVAIKQFQRTWALERGYKTISWTFDPLQRGNANLNLHLLGATANIYHIDFYGEMTDSINAGLPSDRLEVTWSLNSPRVKSLAAGKPPAPLTENLSDEAFILRRAGDSRPSPTEPVSWLPKLFIETPIDLAKLKQTDPDIAHQWRLAQRAALQLAFSRNYIAIDFVSTESHAYYVLQSPETWDMYVVQCSDNTLYTGIALDVDRRVARHNAGRGAAYTSSRRPVNLIAVWRYPNRSAALKAESAFKKLNRVQKQCIIAEKLPYRDAPFIGDQLSNVTE